MKAIAELKHLLNEQFGPAILADDAEVLAAHRGDMTENPPGQPQLVVFPDSSEQVRAVVTAAGRLRIPLTAVVANTNLGGLANPVKGGVVVNLQRMNRILEINEADQYAVIEPGVTWQQLHDKLAAEYPGLRFAYPLSPPDTGIVPNCLMDGLANLSLRVGAAASWINALEVVLPSGELLRTGHWSYGGVPCSRSPFPALEGLFIGFVGSTGIVTRMAVQLWPERRYRRRFFLMAYDVDGAYGLVKKLARMDLADDLGTLSLAAGKMLFGEYRPTWRDPAEPLVFCYIDLSADDEELFRIKQKVVERFIVEQRRQGVKLDGPLDMDDLVRMEPLFAKFADFPTRLDFLLDHPGGGLTWVGTYGPTSRFEEGFRRGAEILDRHGLPPVVVCRPMQGGHFGVLRWITVFDKNDAGEVELVRRVNAELADMAVELGFFPYKTPQWVWERYADRLDPVFRRLVGEVKKLLDPQGIMNPGHLEL